MNRMITTIAMGLISCSALAINLDDTAPTFSGNSVDGRNVNLAWHEDKVTIVTFTRGNCARCVDQLPMLEALYQTYADEGVEVVTVNVGSDADNARALAEQVSFPVVMDESELISEAYTVGRMPYTVLVDKDGAVRYVRSGFWEADEKEYRDRIDIMIRSNN